MTIVILAAGAARRMGRQKLLLPIDGQTMLERVIAAAAAWPTVVVAGDEVAPSLCASGLRVVRNAMPERGMAYSLALGHAAVEAGEPIAVLLGDIPDIDAADIASVLEAFDDTIDVVVPRRGDAFAHPVVFGPRARALITTLSDGDSLKSVRDDPTLRRRVVTSQRGPLHDIDTPSDYARRINRNADAPSA